MRQGKVVGHALISDTHANLPALEEILAEIDARPDVDTDYHLGDLVGYAPWPNEAVALIRSRAIGGVAGDYDSTTGTDHEHCGFTLEAPAVRVTSAQPRCRCPE
jgi:predicted phosphodiesterase